MGGIEKNLRQVVVLPGLSVIVPVYNAEKYLKRCVDSILKQTYADFELLLVDDGSFDRSGFICDEYAVKDSRVRVFHKPNGGVSSARNLGLDNAKGEWIAFIDSDDYVDAVYFDDLLGKAKEADADIVTCDVVIVEGEKETLFECYDWKDTSAESVGEFIVSPLTCVWGGLQKRSLYSKNHLRFPEGIKYCEDFHLLFRLYTYAKKALRWDKALYYYFQHPNSAVHNKNEVTDAGERWVCLDLLRFAGENGIVDVSEKYLSWRLMYASIPMLRSPRRYREFAGLYPAKRKYISTCPFLSKRQKLIAWLSSHYMTIVAIPAFYVCKILGKDV